MVEDFDDKNQLLQRLAEGDKNAYDEIFNRFSPQLYLVAYNFLKDSEQAKDIVMSTLAKLYIKGPSFTHINQLHTYLFLVARNKCIDYFNHQRTTKKIKQEYLKSAAESEVINDQLDGALADALYKCIEQLPVRSREVIVMYYKHGMKYSEIAKKLNISIRTVEFHLRTALERLREALRDKKLEFALLILMISLATALMPVL